jgi:hypothetical protein
MIIDVDSVASNADLATELGSQSALDNLLTDPAAIPSPATQARELALADVIDHLRNRTPPVLAGDLSDVTELGPAVICGALARLYRNNMVTGDGDDISANKHKLYQRMFESRLSALRPTLQASLKSASASIQFSRR